MATKRIQATVSGKVQGVGYRYFATHVAHQLGLDGSVRNLSNGDIEAVAEGEEALLGEFIGQLRQGPSTARVADVLVAWTEPTGNAGGVFTAIA